jgi:hypothetical protein
MTPEQQRILDGPAPSWWAIIAMALAGTACSAAILVGGYFLLNALPDSKPEREAAPPASTQTYQYENECNDYGLPKLC